MYFKVFHEYMMSWKMAEKFSLYAIPVPDVLALYLVFGFECKMYGRRKLNDDKMTNTWSVPRNRIILFLLFVLVRGLCPSACYPHMAISSQSFSQASSIFLKCNIPFLHTIFFNIFFYLNYLFL